jgi:predicted HAD superfamily hydrolase
MLLESFIKDNYTRLTDKQISEVYGTDLQRVLYLRTKAGLKKRPGIKQLPIIPGNEQKIIDEANKLSEMQLLITFCEMTSNKRLKSIAMTRLKTLSGIPINNPFADRTVG